MIGTDRNVVTPTLLLRSTMASADPLGVTVDDPPPAMKYQSPPALLASTCQLYRVIHYRPSASW